MLEHRLERQRRLTGILILVLIFAAILAFLFLTPVSPLLGDLRAGKSANPMPAEGFWGTIGFYERAADNNTTYCLMLTFFILAITKTIRTCFYGKKDLPGSASDQELKNRLHAGGNMKATRR